MFQHRMRFGKNCLKFEDYFSYSEKTNTRSDDFLTLKIKNNRLVSRDGFFTTLSARWFNDLPEPLKAETSDNLFKRGIVEYVKNAHKTPPFDFRPWHRR